jgi:hypothetical protein
MHPQRTGPNTAEGKARLSQNAITHGLTSRHVVLPGENRAEFDALAARLVDEHGAKDTLEIEIIHEIAGCMWRLDRARKAESEYFYVNFIADKATKETERRFALILRYAGAIERELHRAITRLQQLKREQRQQLAVKPEIVSSKSTQPTTDHWPLATNPTTDHRPLAAEFVSQPAASHGPLTTEFVSSASAQLVTSHQPLATKQPQPTTHQPELTAI